MMVQAAMGLAYLKERKHPPPRPFAEQHFRDAPGRPPAREDPRLRRGEGPPGGSGGELTQTGEFLGKLAYASHELLTFGQIDFRSDIYSLGVIFFRLLTKRRPINVTNSRNYLEWVMAQENRAPIDFTVPEGNPPIPDSLQALVLKMLAKKSDDRPKGLRGDHRRDRRGPGRGGAGGFSSRSGDGLHAPVHRAPQVGLRLGRVPRRRGLRCRRGGGASGASPGGQLSGAGAFPFTEEETRAPSSASKVGSLTSATATTSAAASAPAQRSAPAASSASQVPDWLEQATTTSRSRS